MEKNSRGKKSRGRRHAGRSFEFLSGWQGSPSDKWTKVWRRWEGEPWQYLGTRRGKSKNRSSEEGYAGCAQRRVRMPGWGGGELGERSALLSKRSGRQLAETDTLLYKLVFFFFFLKPCRKACRILVLWLGIESALSAVEVWSSNHWAAREVPVRTNLYSEWIEAS